MTQSSRFRNKQILPCATDKIIEMIIYEIVINGEQVTRTGTPDQTSMSLRLNCGDGFPVPKLAVSAFRVSDNELEKHYQWEFPALGIGDEVSIGISEQKHGDPPSVIDSSSPPLSVDQKAMLKHNIAEIKHLNTEFEREISRKNVAKEVDENRSGTIYCSFCGRSQHEVKNLIAGPSVFICNDCVSMCVNIQEGAS